MNAGSLGATLKRLLADVAHEKFEPSGQGSEAKAYTAADLWPALIPAKARDEITGASRIFVVADGPLHRLPFESLVVDARRDERWIDAGPPVVYGPSGTVLMNRRQRAEARKSASSRQTSVALVALGDPAFVPGSQTPQQERSLPALAKATTRDGFGRLPSLPGTRAEVAAIAELFRARAGVPDEAVVVLTGEAATATNLFRVVDSPQFLHLATHGLVDGGRRIYESAVATAAPESLTPDDIGFIRLSDLLTRWGGKLEGTELVTLSACRSARGKLEAGEGFVALTWGFLLAGADSVLASLWKVDDTATALLMTRFYENILGTHQSARTIRSRQHRTAEPLPKADALLEAKRWLRELTVAQARKLAKELFAHSGTRGARYVEDKPAVATGSERPYADPFYWAAFILVGDGS